MGELALERFEKRSLGDISSVSLLNRVDNKYTLSREMLLQLLERLEESHAVVEIDELRSLPYKTLYYDTEDLRCYRDHHNGRRTRVKFRTREYLSSSLVFNEIKQKANTGKTYKSRIKRSLFTHEMDGTFRTFAGEVAGGDEWYVPQLFVEYNRITLVDKELTERLTIDTDLKVTDFSDPQKSRLFSNLVIAESKRERGVRSSPSMDTLRDLRCKPRGFSKYCMGIALLRDDIKKNLFKEHIRFIEKMESSL